jgi:3-hydroxyacyl-CoA dehydrogenase
MGPFSVFDMSGHDIAWAMRKRNAATRDPEQRYVRIADRLCELGHFGRKTGLGWYDHSNGERKLSDAALRLIADERQAKGIVPRDIPPGEIVTAALESMRREGEAILEQGIAASSSDIDVVMVLGYGFPRDKGGPIHAASSHL